MKKILLGAICFCVVTMLQLQVATADNVDADFQSVTINEATLIWDPDIQKGRLKFTIDNQGPADLILMGVEGDLFNSAEVHARVSQDQLATLTSLVVEQEEHLDFSTSHLQVILLPNASKLARTQDVDLFLRLSNGLVPFRAHVQMQSGVIEGNAQ